MPVFEDDPFGPIKQEKKPISAPPREVNLFHSRSDLDTSQTAQHHSLGIKHDQASAGDHVHDSKSSRKVGTGLSLSISGTKNTSASEDSIVAMLKNIIDFTDNRT